MSGARARTGRASRPCRADLTRAIPAVQMRWVLGGAPEHSDDPATVSHTPRGAGDRASCASAGRRAADPAPDIAPACVGAA